MSAPAQPNLPEHGQLLVYAAEDGRLKLEVRLEGETLWLTQQQMSELFQVGVPTINYHLKEIFETGELAPEATIRNFRIVRQEGTREVARSLDFYNLDAVISVGYRVKSAVATRFRIWATQKLREFIVKGFVLDDERLKNPDQPFDYFDELVRRIQDIRTSERRFYQKITDIYATSIDYDPTQPESIEFFQTVQNKLHWAITGQTAAEIIRDRADSAKPNMGLTNWRGAKVRKEDVVIAKNYLNEPELAALNNLVELMTLSRCLPFAGRTSRTCVSVSLPALRAGTLQSDTRNENFSCRGMKSSKRLVERKIKSQAGRFCFARTCSHVPWASF